MKMDEQRLNNQSLGDREFMEAYSDKYNAVRRGYLLRCGNKNLIDFRFSPGDGFMEIPIDELIDSFLKMKIAFEEGNFHKVTDEELREV